MPTVIKNGTLVTASDTIKADGMMIIPIDANGIAAGELVDVRLF